MLSILEFILDINPRGKSNQQQPSSVPGESNLGSPSLQPYLSNLGILDNSSIKFESIISGRPVTKDLELT